VSAQDPTRDAVAADLIERLVGTPDLADACSYLLDRVMDGSGLARGVLLVPAEQGFRAFGWGIEADQVVRITEWSRESDVPFNDLLSRQTPELLPGTMLPYAGFQRCALLPVPAGDGRPSLGVLLVEATQLDEHTAAAVALLRRAGPALARLHDLERLEQRAARLSRQRDLLSGIVESSPDPVLLTNIENDILLTNHRAEQLFSAGPEDNEGRRRAIQINNLLLSSFLTQIAMGSGEARSRELNLVDPGDGSDLLFEVLSVSLPVSVAPEGTVISILRDITDLKQAVSELEAQFSRSRAAEHTARRERDQLNVVLENVGDPILVTDDQSNIILMNPEAERLFEAPQGVPSHAVERRAVRANDMKFTTLISDFLLQPQQRRVEKLELLDTGSGDELPLEVVSSKILNPRGEPTAIVSVLHDLRQAVENERLARELQQLNEQLEDRIRKATLELEEHNRRLEWQSFELEKASRLKSEFLANMSHELRTPINVILGYTSLIRERIYGELTGQQDEALEKVYGTSQHLLELINDILDLSKIEAGKMPLHLEKVDLAEMMDELGHAIDPMLHRRKLEFRASTGAGLTPIRTDRTKLKQVLLNLLSNAVKFTPSGSISLHAECAEEGNVRILVRDTGIGIEPDNLDTIFDDFRQVDQSHTREYGGTGLGLSITRKLLALLGGEISVESVYGEGSSFIVILPIEPPPELVEEQAHRALTDSGSPVLRR
jgi:PAS domain S-box-containing protein